MTSFQEGDDVLDYDYERFKNDDLLRMSQHLAYGNCDSVVGETFLIVVCLIVLRLGGQHSS